MTQTTNDLRAVLESMIDGASMTRVVRELQNVCFDKAEHLESNWQDYRTAKLWRKLALILNAAEAKIVDADPNYPTK